MTGRSLAAWVLFACALLACPTPALGAAAGPDGAVSDAYVEGFADARVGVWAICASAPRAVEIRTVLEVGPPTWIVDETRALAVAFAPRAVRWLDTETLCVAGIEFDAGAAGATVIEAWTFTPPRAGRRADGRETVEPGARTAVRTLFRADLPGMRDVVAMAPRLGPGSPAVLVLFQDSRELWSIETAGLGRMRLQAGPDGTNAPVIADVLARDWVGLDARHHVDGGFAYLLQSGACVVDDEEPVTLLWDRDEDGAIDASEVLSTAEWERRRLGSPSMWR